MNEGKNPTLSQTTLEGNPLLRHYQWEPTKLMDWFNDKLPARWLTLVREDYAQNPLGADLKYADPIFSVRQDFFHGSCGMLTLDHFSWDSNVLSVQDVTNILRDILDQYGKRGHLYIECPSSYNTDLIAVLSVFGKRMFKFGNPYHANRPLYLWLLSSDFNYITSEEFIR